MTQVNNYTRVLLSVINNFRKTYFEANKEFIEEESSCLKFILASIYAKRSDADTNLLQLVNKYIVDLSKYISEEKIAETSKAISEFLHNSKDEILPLFISFANCNAKDSILLPLPEDINFARKINSSNCEGFTQDKESWAFSQISQSFWRNLSQVHLSSLDVKDKKYKFIFSKPKVKADTDLSKIISTYIDLAQNHLEENGEMYCILPTAFCYTKEWLELRQFTSNCGKFSTLLISLPHSKHNLFELEKEELCLFRLKKEKSSKVCLIHTNDVHFMQMFSGMAFSMNVSEKILLAIKEQEGRFYWEGEYKDLTCDYNMIPSRYVTIEPDRELLVDEQIYLISMLTKRQSLKRLTEDKRMPVVGTKDMFSNYYSCEIKLSEISNQNCKGLRIVTSDSLLACYIGGKFKIAKVHGLSETNPLCLTDDIFAFVKPKEIGDCDYWYEAMTEDFFLRSILESPYIQKQANAKAFGSPVKVLQEEDFFSLGIITPPLKQQQAICNEDTRKVLFEQYEKQAKYYEEFRKDMHMKKHAIGQTIFNINNWWKVLMMARRNAGGILDDNAIFGNSQKVKVSEIYDNLQIALSKLRVQLNKFDAGYGMQKEEIALADFIEDYIKSNASPMFEFLFDADSHRLNANWIKDGARTGSYEDNVILRKGEAFERINFPKEALGTIFDNIISNACAHGFAGRSGNKIKFELSQDGDTYILVISNNGAPICEEVNLNDVFTYGVTSQGNNNHYGIGGYEIKKLMREFDGEAEFISAPTEEYPVQYKLTFRDIIIN